jgi:hypothetical protein
MIYAIQNRLLLTENSSYVLREEASYIYIQNTLESNFTFSHYYCVHNSRIADNSWIQKFAV